MNSQAHQLGPLGGRWLSLALQAVTAHRPHLASTAPALAVQGPAPGQAPPTAPVPVVSTFPSSWPASALQPTSSKSHPDPPRVWSASQPLGHCPSCAEPPGPRLPPPQRGPHLVTDPGRGQKLAILTQCQTTLMAHFGSLWGQPRLSLACIIP